MGNIDSNFLSLSLWTRVSRFVSLTALLLVIGRLDLNHMPLFHPCLFPLRPSRDRLWMWCYDKDVNQAGIYRLWYTVQTFHYSCSLEYMWEVFAEGFIGMLMLIMYHRESRTHKQFKQITDSLMLSNCSLIIFFFSLSLQFSCAWHDKQYSEFPQHFQGLYWIKPVSLSPRLSLLSV